MTGGSTDPATDVDERCARHESLAGCARARLSRFPGQCPEPRRGPNTSRDNTPSEPRTQEAQCNLTSHRIPSDVVRRRAAAAYAVPAARSATRVHPAQTPNVE